MKLFTYFEDWQEYRYYRCGKIARYEEGGILICVKCRKKSRLMMKARKG